MHKVLLAKTPVNPDRPTEAETLAGHTGNVLKVSRLLAKRLAPSLAEAILCTGRDLESWRMAVEIGAWIHDWGKANSDFQMMIRDRRHRQSVRHEGLSLFILTELQEWLAPLWVQLPPWVKSAVVFSAGGHHLKFPDPIQDRGTATGVTIFLGHADFAALLEHGARHWGLRPVPQLEDHDLSLLRRGPFKRALRKLRNELDQDFSHREKTLIAATKATVMAADLAGSALPGKSADVSLWLSSRMETVLATEQLDAVVKTKLEGRNPRPFQIRVSETTYRTALVEAGCGGGKTAAAYLWASRHADGKRLFFCYPTTGTASEGFAGYLSDPDFDAVLVHSRAEMDYRLLENMPQQSHEENELRDAGLEALETWPVPAVVCTAHTVLGLLENVRRGLYAWPSIIRSVFVFDEVHAFSQRLFSYLLRFLDAFPGAPVLLMTATLPPLRRQALVECSRRRGGLDLISGPAEREMANRYLLKKGTEEAAWRHAEKCLSSGGKVLWVSNTVKRAMHVLQSAQECNLPVQPYHSRYRYRDRLRRQRAVVDGFDMNAPPLLAATTQVAEMSLDLSADLLVCELGPIPAMIQRMGRLNRFDEKPSQIGTALFIEPDDHRPYRQDELREGNDWLELLADDKPKSQRDLADSFLQVTSDDAHPEASAEHCEWLDGLWNSRKDQRAIEESGHTVEVILEEDVGSAPRTELAIPMPMKRGLLNGDWAREGRYLVAPRGTITYDTFKGAEWKE